MAPHGSQSQDGQGQMRKGRKISRGPDRPLRRDTGMQSGVDEPFEETHQLGADPGKSLQQARQFQHEHQPHHTVVEQGPYAGAVRQQNVPLQQCALRGRDPCLREEAEPCVDAVRGRVIGGELDHRCVRACDGAQCVLVDSHRGRIGIHTPQLLQRQAPGTQIDGMVSTHSTTFAARTTVRRGLKPIQ